MNSRRNFLKVTGAGLTGSLLKPVISTAEQSLVRKSTVKVGVLLSQSNEHPDYPNSFLNGLRLGLNKHHTSKNNRTELITENVNYGSPVLSKVKTQQLISENNVNMIVGLLNSRVALDIGEITEKEHIPTLISNAGENYLNNKERENPYLFFNSLNLFQSSYSAGRFAVEKFGKSIAVVTALYDSGYDALFAFYKGVESAGGIIIDTYLKKETHPNFIYETLDKIEKKNVDGMYVYLNGNLADVFLRTAKQRNLNIPILTTSFAAEDNRLINLGAAADEIQNFCTWNKNLEINENRIFISDYQTQYKKEPDQFSFLGYESGLIINNSVAKCQGNFSGNNLADAIRSCNIKSPGGGISINQKSGQVKKSLYLCKAKVSGFNIPKNFVVDEFVPISEFNEAFVSLDSEMSSGWIKPYLFV